MKTNDERKIAHASKTVYKTIRASGEIPFKELYRVLNYTPAALSQLTNLLCVTGLVETRKDAAGNVVVSSVYKK